MILAPDDFFKLNGGNSLYIIAEFGLAQKAGQIAHFRPIVRIPLPAFRLDFPSAQ
jgi:hypothetical protein